MAVCVHSDKIRIIASLNSIIVQTNENEGEKLYFRLRFHLFFYSDVASERNQSTPA